MSYEEYNNERDLLNYINELFYNNPEEYIRIMNFINSITIVPTESIAPTAPMTPIVIPNNQNNINQDEPRTPENQIKTLDSVSNAETLLLAPRRGKRKGLSFYDSEEEENVSENSRKKTKNSNNQKSCTKWQDFTKKFNNNDRDDRGTGGPGMSV